MAGERHIRKVGSKFVVLDNGPDISKPVAARKARCIEFRIIGSRMARSAFGGFKGEAIGDMLHCPGAEMPNTFRNALRGMLRFGKPEDVETLIRELFRVLEMEGRPLHNGMGIGAAILRRAGNDRGAFFSGMLEVLAASGCESLSIKFLNKMNSADAGQLDRIMGGISELGDWQYGETLVRLFTDSGRPREDGLPILSVGNGRLADVMDEIAGKVNSYEDRRLAPLAAGWVAGLARSGG